MDESRSATVTIGGVPFTVTGAQVLRATRYKRPPSVGHRGQRQWVTIRERQVPARWALVVTLQDPERPDADRARAAAEQVQTWHGVTAMARLGFPTGRSATPEA